MKTLYVLCGLPGSGKSTWAMNMRNAILGQTTTVSKDSLREMVTGGYYVYDPDTEPMIKDMAYSCILEAAKHRSYAIFIDETHLTVRARHVWIGNTALSEYEKKCVWCTETEMNLLNRMKEARGYSEEKWKSVIVGMSESFEPPSVEEGFDEVIKVGREYNMGYNRYGFGIAEEEK